MRAPRSEPGVVVTVVDGEGARMFVDGDRAGTGAAAAGTSKAHDDADRPPSTSPRTAPSGTQHRRRGPVITPESVADPEPLRWDGAVARLGRRQVTKYLAWG